ncbi:hypothetical protein BLNAU_5041 [Blattamonas nauphoetae]|uniref:Uncharacterized protein n=1 Tax=Blattamonas nauphoetae TaxID=2049346 RepID=A0ABQ9Y8Z2_9EUKA|nr:hypothetical protein BLNAU_5041 [Blattamonas nauphoetae]
MIDSLPSFIRKEMKTRTIKLVTLNPTRIVDNAQSELIVVFFPPSASTGLDETKRAPNAFEMSVVGFDEFSIEPLFVTAGEKSMLLNSHLKTRMSVGEEVEEGRKRRRGRINLSNSSSISCERGPASKEREEANPFPPKPKDQIERTRREIMKVKREREEKLMQMEEEEKDRKRQEIERKQLSYLPHALNDNATRQLQQLCRLL